MFAYVGRQSVCVPRCSYVFRFAATYLLCITLNPQVLGSSPRGRTRSEGVTALQLLARSAILGSPAKQSLLRKRKDRGTCSFSSRERREGFCWLPCPCRSYFHPQRRSAKQCESPSLPAPGTHGAASNRSPVRCSVPSAPRSPK